MGESMTPDPNELMPEEITEALRIIELHMGFYCCKDDRLFLEKVIRASHPREVEEVTVEDISQHIEAWKFNDHNVGTFGEYLRGKFPNGLKIKAGGVK